MVAKEHAGGDLDCVIFNMDIRTFGKDYEKYYNRAKDKEGIRFGFYNEGDIVVNLNSIKWYEDFEEVRKITKFFEDAVNDNEGGEDFVRFIRIGEDPEDREVMGYYEEDQLYIPSPGICW